MDHHSKQTAVQNEHIISVQSVSRSMTSSNNQKEISGATWGWGEGATERHTHTPVADLGFWKAGGEFLEGRGDSRQKPIFEAHLR